MKTDYSKMSESLDNFCWRVQEIETENIGYFRDHPNFSVTLNGFIAGRIPTFNFEDLVSNLESKLNPSKFKNKSLFGFRIKNVIFNGPATIVEWSDGIKTVVKTQNGEEFDPEKGLAMAIAKRMFGNTGSYFNEIKKWLPEEVEESSETCGNSLNELVNGLNNMAKQASKMGFTGSRNGSDDIDMIHEMQNGWEKLR